MEKDDFSKKELVLERSLQGFFFDQLIELNKKTAMPLPKETIYYSSIVMDKFSQSKDYFEVQDGKVREKTLGKKLLESSSLSRVGQKRALQDVGDTALLLCGFFSESLNKKIIDLSYYHEIGKIAYCRLNSMIPDVFHIDSFYDLLSKKFKEMTIMMTIVAQQSNMFCEAGQDVIFISNERKIKVS